MFSILILRRDRVVSYLDGRPQVRTGDHELLFATRAFMEARIRERVLRLPGVCYSADGDSGTLAADIVVDAMGRGSRMAGWLAGVWRFSPR